MLRLHLIEIILRLIPEALLIVWGIRILTRKSISFNYYILSSIIIGLLSFFVRMLPIYFGMHTFINTILVTCVMVIIGVPIIKAMYGTLLMFLVLSLSEFLNVAILDLLNVNTQFANPVIKSVLGMPALVIMYLFIIIIHYFIKRKEGLTNVSN